jgi:hypothetical protein
MIRKRVWLFLVLAIVFTVVHLVASQASLYWYYWWFDEGMHTWGGIMIALGVHAIATFSNIKKIPSLRHVLGVTFLCVVSWEIFEWYAELYNPVSYAFDTIKDMILGMLGSGVAHKIITKIITKSHV